MGLEVLPGVPVRPLSVWEYDRMVAAGILSRDDRVELVEGVLVPMTPQGVAHAEAIVRLADWAYDHVDRERFVIRLQLPLRCGATSEPEPDLAVVPRHGAPGRHPDAAALVVEVCASSEAKDLVLKRRVYAAAGVPQYWVAVLSEGRLQVHEDPRGEDYAQVRRADVAVFGGARLRAADLIA